MVRGEDFEKNYSNFTTTLASLDFLVCCKSLKFIEVAGSGGRDRTADLGVMNAGRPVVPIHSNL